MNFHLSTVQHIQLKQLGQRNLLRIALQARVFLDFYGCLHRIDLILKVRQVTLLLLKEIK